MYLFFLSISCSISFKKTQKEIYFEFCSHIAAFFPKATKRDSNTFSNHLKEMQD